MTWISMNKNRFILSVLCLLLMLALCLPAGCTQPANETPQETPAETPAAPEEQAPPTERVITDMAGRSVTIPYEVKNGLGSGAIGSYMLYTMDPSTMVGVNYEFNDMEKAYILPDYHGLPAFGQGGNFNLEAVIDAAPDVLIIYGSLNDSAIADADAMQEQSGIPCIMLGQDMAMIPAAYRLLGEVFGQEQRCEQLAAYAEEALAFAATIDIPEERRVRVYFGNGIENLETAPKGSSHAELLELVQAINVAQIEGDVVTRIDVSAEQVLGWDPAVVILNGEPTENMSPAQAAQEFAADSRYRNVQAVQNGQVYAIPKYPYSWFDRPPGPNRLIGIYWLAGLLYPEDFTLDIKAEAREFYSLFYHLDLTDEQLVDLLGY